MKNTLAIHLEDETVEYSFGDRDEENAAFHRAFTNLDAKQVFKNIMNPEVSLLINAARSGDHCAARRLIYSQRGRAVLFSVYYT